LLPNSGGTSVNVVVVRAVVVLGIVLVCTGVACRARSSAVAPPPATPPATPEGCRACRGLWAVHGLDDKPSCNCRTADAGKRCRDGRDCQGMCIVSADKPEVELLQAGPPARGFFVGHCSALVTVFGCNRLLERGASAAGPGPVAEPPPTICVD
jgi:hypothetical protein